MKCTGCDGTGNCYVLVRYGDPYEVRKELRRCPKCYGKGIIEPLTHAEYMRQCDDASLAFEIWNLIKDGNIDDLYHIERWLKEERNA